MSRHIQLLISEEFAERIIPENDSVRLLDEIIDGMDLSKLFHTYSHIGRLECYHKSRVAKRTKI